MNKSFGKVPADKPTLRKYPKLRKDGDGQYSAVVDSDAHMTDLMGMKTDDAARSVYLSSVTALGETAERYSDLASAMFAEIEPKGAVEAMLVSQMTVTHVAMTRLSERMTYQTSYQVRESLERSMTRLSRTYLAQMDALKKYRAKAQQVVRVERVTVNDGGQAIVGHLAHGGRAEDEK